MLRNLKDVVACVDMSKVDIVGGLELLHTNFVGFFARCDGIS